MIQTTPQTVDVPSAAGERTDRSPARGVARRFQRLGALPHLGTWIGIVLSALGAVLLMIGWARTAALTDVSLQLPYVVSAGFTGLGLVAIGLTVVNLSAKHEDARARADQIGELRGLLAELRRVTEGADR